VLFYDLGEKMNNLYGEDFFNKKSKHISLKNKTKGRFKMNNSIKTLVVVASTALFAVFAFFFFFNIKMIEPGNAGIKIKLTGEDRGVQDIVLVSGRIIYPSFFWRVEEFPTYTQIMNWTKNPTEGSPNDDSITFNSVEVSAINADVSISYHFSPEKIPHIYLKYRKSPENIMRIDIRSAMRGSFDKLGAKMKIMDICGLEKENLLKGVIGDLNTQYEEIGIVFEHINFIGKLRVDPKVEEQINAAIGATQKAIEAQNKVAEVTALAQQAVAKAKGNAEAIKIEAEAQAEANKIISLSMTPQVATSLFIEKWDGRMPMVMGSDSNSLIQIPAEVKELFEGSAVHSVKNEPVVVGQ
jgi:regulator of protease activity HflC (stomatin/prohibitin superfamily)